MKRKMSLVWAVVLIVAMLFTGCGNGGNDTGNGNGDNGDNGAAEDKNNVVIGMSTEAVSLDPEYNGDTSSQTVTLNIFESLVRQDGDAFVPSAAESWDISDDGMEYVFYLYEGNKFHNGNELTAEDVKYTYERANESPFAAELVECVDHVEVVDQYTAKIVLLYPYGPFLSLAACPQLGIVDQETVEAAGDGFGRHPVGSGPYKFVEWVNGSKIELEAYEDFHLGQAPIKTVVWKVMADLSTAMIALEKGEIDALIEPASIDKQRIADMDTLELYEVPALRINYMTLNCDQEPFDNSLVRQAIAYAVNKVDIMSAGAEGNGEIAENMIAPTAFGYTDKVKQYPRDLDKARDLLAQAGYPDGFDTTIMVSSGPNQKMAEVVQANLSEIGINCQITLYEWGTFLDSAQKGDFDLLIAGWGYLAPDADQGLYATGHSSQIGGAKFDRYVNPRLDELLVIGRQSADQDERASAYEEISQIMHDESPVIPFYWGVASIAANKNLKGVSANSMKFYYAYDYSW